jgi:hypothetical protein
VNIHSVYTKKCSNYKLKRYFCILNCIKKRKYCDFFLSCRKVSIIFRFEYQSAVDFSILKNCKLTTKPAYSKHILFSPVDLNSNLRKSGILACIWLSYLDQSDLLHCTEYSLSCWQTDRGKPVLSTPNACSCIQK